MSLFLRRSKERLSSNPFVKNRGMRFYIWLLTALCLPCVSHLSSANAEDYNKISGGVTLKFHQMAGYRDENNAFEGIDAVLTYRFNPLKKENKNKTFSWRAGLRWEAGSILLYPWFLSLEEQKGRIYADGTWSTQGKFIRNASLAMPLIRARARNLFVPASGKITLALLLKQKNSSMDAEARLQDLFPVAIQEPFSLDHPIVQRFSATGMLQANIRDGKASLDLSGTLYMDQLPVLKQIELHGAYPLADSSELQGQDSSQEDANCLPGMVSWESLDLERILNLNRPADQSGDHRGLLQLKEKRIPLTICRNGILGGPMTLLFPRGSIKIEKAGFRKTGKKNYAGKGVGTREIFIEGITIEDLDIKTLFSAIPWKILVQGSGLKAVCQEDRIRFSGSITVFVAKGTIEITDIWAEPFAPIPRFGADIKFQGIDLESLTAPTDFGLMTGQIKGTISGLVISGTQPESFRLTVTNDPGFKGEQRISIKAIENLSILGGGQGGIPILGAFFKSFPYSRIGISCSLKNDVFELHGLTRKNGVEYLIERGFWGGVNVVNMNPEGRISFADMVDRLKRIASSNTEKMEVKTR